MQNILSYCKQLEKGSHQYKMYLKVFKDITDPYLKKHKSFDSMSQKVINHQMQTEQIQWHTNNLVSDAPSKFQSPHFSVLKINSKYVNLLSKI